MSLDKNFRSALNGFNRSDVVNYIEENSIAQEKALRQLRDEIAKLRTATDKLRAEKDELAEKLSAVEASATTEAASEPVTEPLHLPPCVPGELELTAYRRAESTERSARLRARKLCRQVNEIIETASTKMVDSTDDVQTLMQDLSINLRRLTDAFAALKLTFDDTSDALESVDLLDITEYNA